jgi:hypothetical protein
VAKRSEQLKQLGWKAQVSTPQEPEKISKANYQRKTYLIAPEMVDRVKATAEQYRVGQNELVRFLLGYSLDQLDQGKLELPLEETYRIKK